jgi:(1->4)-alpha-D-glucan 1-alpha-D-glucosylmutase
VTGPSLEERCASLGVVPTYRDYTGQLRQSPASTLEALIGCLATRPCRESLPPVVLLPVGSDPQKISLQREVLLEGALRWEIEAEGEKPRRGDVPERESDIVIAPPLPAGDYRLRLFAFAPEATRPLAERRLVVTPPRAFLPPCFEGRGRVWGFAIQLFALRSARNWGIGDFTDLLALIDHAAALGAGVVGLNPLHALFPDLPDRASPYSPNSRDHLNFIYIDPEALPEFDECEAARCLRTDPEFQAELARLRAGELVDYRGVAACKLRVLRLLFDDFRCRHLLPGDAYGNEFRVFQRGGGPGLRLLAAFQLLRQHMGARASVLKPWWDWPADYRNSSSPAIHDFIRAHETEIEFFEYQQWHASRQLERCTEQARKAGMPIGLYQDIAIGVDRDSAEAWSSQGYLVDEWSIGAPPDNWNALGQKWGTPPPHPHRMAETGYGAFRQTLRANMRAAGAVRIDHAIGLMRLFWIPAAASAAEGAFVLYPLPHLLALIALESQKARCVVVGEDLGTVPDGLQDALVTAGILSYRLLYFERDGEGRFRKPEAWPAQALAAATTHDLPTLPGYWAGQDIEIKERLGLFVSSAMAEEARRRRELDRRELVEMLRAEGLEASLDQAPIESLYRHLARTPSKILMVQLEDLLGVTEQVNMPGTIDEHPNWRRKLPKTVAEIFGDSDLVGMVAAIRREREDAAAGAGSRS